VAPSLPVQGLGRRGRRVARDSRLPGRHVEAVRPAVQNVGERPPVIDPGDVQRTRHERRAGAQLVLHLRELGVSRHGRQTIEDGLLRGLCAEGRQERGCRGGHDGEQEDPAREVSHGVECSSGGPIAANAVRAA
jgi:hypothetical protein